MIDLISARVVGIATRRSDKRVNRRICVTSVTIASVATTSTTPTTAIIVIATAVLSLVVIVAAAHGGVVLYHTSITRAVAQTSGNPVLARDACLLQRSSLLVASIGDR